MALHRICAAIFLATTASACYVESVDEGRDAIGARKLPSDQRDDAKTSLTDVGQCRFTGQKGCFDGHVISKKEFVVEGKAFFNADDLATRFSELITVEQLGDRLRDTEDYRLELLTAMDNPSFLQGFEYYLSGATVRSGHVRSNGVFNINELNEGTYDLRLQKTLKFQVIRAPAEDPVPESTEPTTTDAETESAPETAPMTRVAGAAQPQAVVKTYCATIYTDKTIDVRRGERLWDAFNEFRLHVIARDCPAAGSGRVVTL